MIKSTSCAECVPGRRAACREAAGQAKGGARLVEMGARRQENVRGGVGSIPTTETTGIRQQVGLHPNLSGMMTVALPGHVLRLHA